MSIAALMLLAMITGGAHAVRSGCIPLEPTRQANTSSGQGSQLNSRPIKITIATVEPRIEQRKIRFALASRFHS